MATPSVVAGTVEIFCAELFEVSRGRVCATVSSDSGADVEGCKYFDTKTVKKTKAIEAKTIYFKCPPTSLDSCFDHRF